MSLSIQIIDLPTSDNSYSKLKEIAKSYDQISEEQFFGEAANVVHAFEFATASLSLVAAIISLRSKEKAVTIFLDGKKIDIHDKSKDDVERILNGK